VYVFFILFGIAQERINTREYGATRERMTHTLALIAAQCSTNALFALGALWLAPAVAGKRAYMAPLAIGKMSASYIGAMFASNLALQFINYPTQVLVKSCKMVPVMAANVLMGTHVYSRAARARVLLLTAGIASFLLLRPAAHARAHGGGGGGGGGGAASDDGAPDAAEARRHAIGLGLAAASLACDGYTGGAQDRIVRAARPSAHQLMLWTNVWACALLGGPLALGGEGAAAVRFCARHPEVLRDLALFVGASALGQNFIYYSIARFGALPTTVITTTRKFFTILASVAWFGHPLGGGQWAAIACVFGALASELASKAGRVDAGAGARRGASDGSGSDDGEDEERAAARGGAAGAEPVAARERSVSGRGGGGGGGGGGEGLADEQALLLRRAVV
jgi:UDP-galactose transporter B1